MVPIEACKAETKKIKIGKAILVEGRYDKIKLSSILDAQILTCDGFGIFREKEKQAYFRRIAKEKGIIVLTDADGGGLVIRGFLRSALPKEGVIHLYIPAREGREKRKKTPSKEGLLGVEGMDADFLRSLFRPFAEDGKDGTEEKNADPMTNVDFYNWRLNGGAGSSERRKKLAAALSLPQNLSSSALLEAVNLLSNREEVEKALESIKKDEIL